LEGKWKSLLSRTSWYQSLICYDVRGKENVELSFHQVSCLKDMQKTGGIASHILALDGGVWSASCPCHFSWEKALSISWVEIWLGPRAVWKLWRKEKSLASAGKQTLIP
jgi:hypothetical protein